MVLTAGLKEGTTEMGTQEYRRGRRYRLGRKGSLIQEVAMMEQLTGTADGTRLVKSLLRHETCRCKAMRQTQIRILKLRTNVEQEGHS